LSRDGSITVGPWAGFHVSKDGGMTVGPLAEQANEAIAMLSEMYSTRAERVLYMSADADVPFQNVADIIDAAQNFHYQDERATPMRVEVRLVTRGAIETTCPAECFNWVKNPLVVH